MMDKQYSDRTERCIECHLPWIWKAAEQAVFAKRGYKKPRLCHPCRDYRRAEREAEQRAAS